MRPGVYRVECGGMVELSAIDETGRLIMRITVDEGALLPSHAVIVHEALDRFDPRVWSADSDENEDREERAVAIRGRGDTSTQLGPRWESVGLVLRRARRQPEFGTRADIAAALGVKPRTLRHFARGFVTRPAWLPLALVAHVRDATRGMEPARAVHFLAPLDELLAEVEVRRRGDPEYARQWAEDRASMPPELEGLAL